MKLTYYDYKSELAEQGRRTMLYTTFDDVKLSNFNNMKRHQRAHDLITAIGRDEHVGFSDRQMHLLHVDIERNIKTWC